MHLAALGVSRFDDGHSPRKFHDENPKSNNQLPAVEDQNL